MGRKPKEFFSALRDDVVKAVVVAIAVALATGIPSALLSGAWQAGLLAFALTVLFVVLVLGPTAFWHSQALKEDKFDETRAQDAEERGLVKFERDQRDQLTRAATRPPDSAGHKADVSTTLERWRKHISSGRVSPIELLILSETNPNAPRPIAQAGSFDQAVLTDPSRLTAWLEEQGDRAYPCLLQIEGEFWRVLGIADTALDAYDKFQIQRLANYLVALKLAHRAAAGGLQEESA